jgi:hypothetical protein
MEYTQSTINEIVEEFFTGKRETASAFYKERLFEDAGAAPEDFVSCGTVIPNHCLEPDLAWDVEDRLQNYVTEERLEAISKGAELTQDEKEDYRRSVIAQVKDGTSDADVIPGYWARRLRHTDGREVFALETVNGYSFSGVTNTFHGLFQSVEETFKDLSTWGVVIPG